MITFVVGEEEDQQSFCTQSAVIEELCPMVKAAMANDCREATTRSMLLPQFVPLDFELFLRLIQATAASHSPQINAPTVSDDLIICVAPIAAYLGAEKMLAIIQAHVQATPTLETFIAIDTVTEVEWSSSQEAYDGLLRLAMSSLKLVRTSDPESYCLDVLSSVSLRKLLRNALSPGRHIQTAMSCCKCKKTYEAGWQCQVCRYKN